MLADEITREWVRTVGQCIEDNRLFQDKARQAASELGIERLADLLICLHDNDIRPGLSSKNEDTLLGGFIDYTHARHAAICEIFYFLGEPALPALAAIVCGPYDWSQIDAIQVLCRLGIEGVETESIAELFTTEIDSLRYEVRQEVMRQVCTLALQSPTLARFLQDSIREVADERDVNEDTFYALGMLEPLIEHTPALAMPFEKFYRTLLRETGLSSYPENDWFESVDALAIEAAKDLLKLFPGDKEASEALRTWSESHPDLEIRDEIKSFLGEKGIQ